MLYSHMYKAFIYKFVYYDIIIYKRQNDYVTNDNILRYDLYNLYNISQTSNTSLLTHFNDNLVCSKFRVIYL